MNNNTFLHLAIVTVIVITVTVNNPRLTDHSRLFPSGPPLKRMTAYRRHWKAVTELASATGLYRALHLYNKEIRRGWQGKTWQTKKQDNFRSDKRRVYDEFSFVKLCVYYFSDIQLPIKSMDCIITLFLMLQFVAVNSISPTLFERYNCWLLCTKRVEAYFQQHCSKPSL